MSPKPISPSSRVTIYVCVLYLPSSFMFSAMVHEYHRRPLLPNKCLGSRQSETKNGEPFPFLASNTRDVRWYDPHGSTSTFAPPCIVIKSRKSWPIGRKCLALLFPPNLWIPKMWVAQSQVCCLMQLPCCPRPHPKSEGQIGGSGSRKQKGGSRVGIYLL